MPKAKPRPPRTFSPVFSWCPQGAFPAQSKFRQFLSTGVACSQQRGDAPQSLGSRASTLDPRPCLRPSSFPSASIGVIRGQFRPSPQSLPHSGDAPVPTQDTPRSRPEVNRQDENEPFLHSIFALHLPNGSQTARKPSFRSSDFGIRTSFGLRISDFGFPASPVGIPPAMSLGWPSGHRFTAADDTAADTKSQPRRPCEPRRRPLEPTDALMA